MRALLLLGLCSCSGGPLVVVNSPSSGVASLRGTGVTATQVRRVSDFDQVRTESFVDVVATVGPGHSAELTCDDNLLPHLDTVVERRTLVVTTRASAGSLEPKARCLLKTTAPTWVGVASTGSGNVVLTGPAPGLRSASTSGSGDVVVTGIDSDAVEISTTGSGDIKVSGRARGLTVETTGSGKVMAEGLATSVATARTTGSGDIAVRASDTVDATSLGSGDVVVDGGAAVHADARGSGRIVSRPADDAPAEVESTD